MCASMKPMYVFGAKARQVQQPKADRVALLNSLEKWKCRQYACMCFRCRFLTLAAFLDRLIVLVQFFIAL
ncbi:hypothetical protein L596_003359 [Steinernema carpocapsae]|uniref:Uncharacterized protein n=1 Tax=Steinernema carpocapsae TaxID=34508 RepID=A0A4U8UV94_STECR|nr:hypothetical protein L596_003359 [Steinernema carpocapsae]